MGILSHATLSFVHHLVAIHELKLAIQTENDQLGSKLAIFHPMQPLNLTDDLEKQ